ncbi:hypothetical protein VOLCADRAFT_92304 [Volvox carteri f. nagariensis]|uniref:Uncharacterized protein n=1 Tax=Volvox carteri f. nagariensis TaxID=3068 RepID=D8TZB2_VOLCA|nr:uncharacterized protein VOLCADRAFT_92304 [Volvox carteri f. nagariensis]EFJ47152.1 hypothetical protein VOLCADRAFT_92304 [Volvox carteri f. nagariensis]|eukprot:XP_002951701.1 hypothetical protein VOLCADRAFT_92304 [Volvox carteri f. nagariensis]
MTSAVFIQHEPSARGPGHFSSTSYGSSPAGSLPAFSPPSAYAYSGSSSAGGDKANPYLAAKKFWKRLCFDPALDPTEYKIGFIETVQQPERKSGVEAWSMRLHDRLCELPYNLFVERFCGGAGDGSLHPANASPSAAVSTSDEAASDVPYHRIAYFKHGNVVVWESEYHKRRLNDLAPANPAAGGSDGGGASASAIAAAMATATATTPRGERSRRQASRDGMPPLPAASSGLLSLGSGFSPPSSRSLLSGLGSGGGSFSVPRPGRSPRGASPRASDDGIDGTASDDGELQLLLEDDEQEGEDEGGSDTDGGDDEDVGVEGPGAANTTINTSSSVSSKRALRLSPARKPGGAGGGYSGDGAVGVAIGGGAAVCEATPPPLPQLPEECWMAMLQQLGVRDVCMVGRTCRWLRQLAGDPGVWRAQYCSLWGSPPEHGLTAGVVRRMCRRSQLRAARWLEARVVTSTLGFPSTTCLQMDDSKVVSGDGNAVRLWEHATGRRIATLQGHPGRVSCVAFDDSTLVSGCVGSVVKLWSMDDLRCRRTLRGHEGAVRSCCLLPTGIPVSGAEDGLVRLWDVASGSAIVSLEAGAPVMAVQAHGQSGHLVSAAGWGIQIWDVSTATLLQTLGAANDEDTTFIADAGAVAAGGGAIGIPAGHHPYTCVSYMGDLLAAGRQGEVVLLDPRVGGTVGRLTCETRSGGAGTVGASPSSGIGAIAAAAGGGGGGNGYGGKGAPCVGAQLDEWKLVCGFNDGRHLLHVYDIRSIPKVGCGGGGGARRDWHQPLMTLKAPNRINTFQFHEQALLMGLEGSECSMWRFENPTQAMSSSGSSKASAARFPALGLLPLLISPVKPCCAAAEKKKPAKVAKKQTRYPKRNTK